MKNEKIIVVNMKEIPPPEAVGLICELLLLGLSTKNFEKKELLVLILIMMK